MLQSDSTSYPQQKISSKSLEQNHCPDRECQGLLILQGHELICSECGWVIEDLQLDQWRGKETAKIMDSNHNAVFIIGPHVGMIGFQPKYLRSYKAILGLQSGWEAWVYLKLQMARRVLISFDYNVEFRNRVLDRFCYLSRRFYTQFYWGVIFLVTIQEQCLQDHRYCHPTNQLMKILREFNMKVPKSQVARFQKICKINIQNHSDDYIRHYLNLYFGDHPDHSLQAICKQNLNKIKNISGRTARGLTGAIIWYSAQKLGKKEVTQTQIGRCLQVSTISIRAFLKLMVEKKVLSYGDTDESTEQISKL